MQWFGSLIRLMASVVATVAIETIRPALYLRFGGRRRGVARGVLLNAGIGPGYTCQISVARSDVFSRTNLANGSVSICRSVVGR